MTSRAVPRVAIVTNVVPSYRQGFYDRLFGRDDVRVHVYCQDQLPGTNVKAIHARYPTQVTAVGVLRIDLGSDCSTSCSRSGSPRVASIFSRS